MQHHRALGQAFDMVGILHYTGFAGGHDVRSVAARLGHADPTTTMRIYAHALEGLDGAIAETLAGVLDGKEQR